MASKEFSEMAAAEAGMSQSPPPYDPDDYGYDQHTANKAYASRTPTNYGYDQPGDRDPYQPSAYGQPGRPASSSSHTNVIVTSGLIVVSPVRESGPPPDTACGLIISILVTFLCGWPCGIGAIVANRRARSHVEGGQYTQARSALTTMWIWVTISILVGIGVWVYVGFRLKSYMHSEAELRSDYNYNYNSNYNNYNN